jgi:hypothetical protein
MKISFPDKTPMSYATNVPRGNLPRPIVIVPRLLTSKESCTSSRPCVELYLFHPFPRCRSGSVEFSVGLLVLKFCSLTFLPIMSALQGYSHFKHFNVTSPVEYVAHLEINRPEKLNAFIEDMWIEIGQVFDKLSVDPDVRAVVLTGAGERAFTAGLDVQAASQSGLTSPKAVDGARVATKQRRHIYDFQECITKIERCEKRKLQLQPPAQGLVT